VRENDHDEMARALAEEKKRSYARAEEQKQKKRYTFASFGEKHRIRHATRFTNEPKRRKLNERETPP
jgi:hypothetical protein